MLTPNNFKDYELLDASNGEKLERWGKYILLRPDPTVIWDNGNLIEKYKGKIDAVYYRSNKGGGHWENFKKIPSTWTIKYQDLTFNIKQMGFKHTGIFPEQAVNWEYMMNKIEHAKRHIKVLNLFGYTGAASVACLKAGASVTHVDSSKGMVEVCKENVISSGLKDRPIRYLVDDVVKFVKREIRRGNKYDAIVMDPPSDFAHIMMFITYRAFHPIFVRQGPDTFSKQEMMFCCRWFPADHAVFRILRDNTFHMSVINSE